MEFPQDYTFALTQSEISIKWPKLKEGENFRFTSLKRKGFNCVAYALMQENKDLDMLVFCKLFGLDKNLLDHSAKGYAEIFEKYYGYCICDNINVEDGFIKIALYENNDGDFLHLTRQLPDGKWTSKMGGYEDIEHDTLHAIEGEFYGYPVLIMKKSKSGLIKLF